MQWLQARSRPRGRERRIVPPAILREEYFTARFIARLRPLINRREMQPGGGEVEGCGEGAGGGGGGDGDDGGGGWRRRTKVGGRGGRRRRRRGRGRREVESNSKRHCKLGVSVGYSDWIRWIPISLKRAFISRLRVLIIFFFFTLPFFFFSYYPFLFYYPPSRTCERTMAKIWIN